MAGGLASRLCRRRCIDIVLPRPSGGFSASVVAVIVYMYSSIEAAASRCARRRRAMEEWWNPKSTWPIDEPSVSANRTGACGGGGHSCRRRQSLLGVGRRGAPSSWVRCCSRTKRP